MKPEIIEKVLGAVQKLASDWETEYDFRNSDILDAYDTDKWISIKIRIPLKKSYKISKANAK